MFKKVIVIDGQGHLMGRLASYVAKQLLSGIKNLMQDKESSSSELKESTSLGLCSEIK